MGLTLAEHLERKRLAGLLHDHLQQLLAAAKFRLDVLVRRLGRNESESATGIARLLDEAIQVSRSLTMELSPPVLHEGGLAAGLEWLVRRMREQHGLRVDLSVGTGTEVGREELKLFLFEAVHELLLNVVRHAGVKCARVETSRLPSGRLPVVVSDEGTGSTGARSGAIPPAADSGSSASGSVSAFSGARCASKPRRAGARRSRSSRPGPVEAARCRGRRTPATLRAGHDARLRAGVSG